MILTRRHVGGRAIRRDRARSRSLICSLLFYMRGDPLFYERRALVSVVPAHFLNSTETDEIFMTCSETTRVNTELGRRIVKIIHSVQMTLRNDKNLLNQRKNNQILNIEVNQDLRDCPRLSKFLKKKKMTLKF